MAKNASHREATRTERAVIVLLEGLDEKIEALKQQRSEMARVLLQELQGEEHVYTWKGEILIGRYALEDIRDGHA